MLPTRVGAYTDWVSGRTGIFSGWYDVSRCKEKVVFGFLQKNGIEALPYIQEDAFTSEAGYRMMKTILGNEDRPSAVFCASDPIAIGALRALQEAGIRVPEEISLVGFDDINAARFTNPPLTTIHAPAPLDGAIWRVAAVSCAQPA